MMDSFFGLQILGFTKMCVAMPDMCKIELVGSCGSLTYKKDSDINLALYCGYSKSDLDKVCRVLESNKLCLCNDRNTYGVSGLLSYTMDKVNVIVCNNYELFLAFKQATDICRILEVSEKRDRIAVHSILFEKFLPTDKEEGS